MARATLPASHVSGPGQHPAVPPKRWGMPRRRLEQGVDGISQAAPWEGMRGSTRNPAYALYGTGGLPRDSRFGALRGHPVGDGRYGTRVLGYPLVPWPTRFANVPHRHMKGAAGALGSGFLGRAVGALARVAASSEQHQKGFNALPPAAPRFSTWFDHGAASLRPEAALGDSRRSCGRPLLHQSFSTRVRISRSDRQAPCAMFSEP
jgi:hypothetical protein